VGAGVRAGRAFVEISADDALLARGLASAQAKLAAFGRSVTSVGTDMLALSGSMLTPIIAGSKVFAGFQQQMAMVGTLMTKPQEVMERFGYSVADMSMKFGEGTETLSKGLYDILSAAIAPEKAMSVLTASAKAAKAGLSDTAVAVDAITTVLNSYGLGAEKAADVSDWLFQVVNRGKLTFSDMAADIGKSASLAHTAGLSLEEVGGFIATLTRNGVQSSTAMTGLNAVIKSFLKPSIEATKVAEEIGFSLDGVTLRSLGLFGAFQALAGLPPDTLAKLFPDIDALKGVLPAMNDMKGFAEDIKIMADRAGSTETAYKTMTSTMAFAFDQLKQSGVETMRVLGAATSENVSLAIDKGKQALAVIRDWISGHKDLINAAVRAAATIGIVGGALVVIGMAISTVAVPLGALAGLMTALTVSLAAATIVAGAFWMAVTSPIGLVLLGVAALGVAFLAMAQSLTGVFTDTFSQFPGVWTLVQQTLEAAWGLMKAVWSGDTEAMGAAWELLKLNVIILWNRLWEVLKSGWKDMMEVWDRKTEIMRMAWDRAMKVASEKWEAFTKVVKRKWNEVMDEVMRQWDKVWEVIGPAWKEMDKLWKEYGKTVMAVAISVGVVVAVAKVLLATWGLVTAAVTAVGTAIAAVVAFVTSPLGILIIAIGGIAAAFYLLVPKVKTSVDGMFGHLGKAWDAAWGILKAAWTLMTDTFSGNAKEKKEAWSKFTKAVGPLWATVKAELSKSWTALTGDWTHEIAGMREVWLNFKANVIDAWDFVKGLLDDGFTYIADVWYNNIDGMDTDWWAICGSIKDTFWKVYDRLSNLIGELKEDFVDFVAWIRNSFLGALDSLISKLSSAWSWVKSLGSFGAVKVAVSTSAPAAYATPTANLSAAVSGLTAKLSNQLAAVSGSISLPSVSLSQSGGLASLAPGDNRATEAAETMVGLLKDIKARVSGLSTAVRVS